MNKRFSKRTICVILCLLLLVMLLSACTTTANKQDSNGKEDISNEVEKTEADNIYAEKIKISILHKNTHHDNQPFADDDTILKHFEDKFNVDIDLIYVPSPGGEVFDKLNMMVASGNIPDMFIINSRAQEIYRNLFEGDKLVNITTLIKSNPSRYPELTKALQDKSAIEVYAEQDASFYIVPRIYGHWPHAWYIRSDWLNKLNLEKPETLDEVYDVLKKFVTEDPDGNNNLGLTFAGPWWLGHIYAGFTGAQDWALRNGKIVSVWTLPEQKDALKYVNKLYKEKLLDKEMFMHNTEQMRSIFVSGKAGIMILDFTYFLNTEEQLKGYRQDAEIDLLNPELKGPNYLARMGASKWFEGISVSNSTKDPERCFDLLEYILSSEGKEILRNGIEGKHYTMKNGKKVINEELFKHENWGLEGLQSAHRFKVLVDLEQYWNPQHYKKPEIIDYFYGNLDRVSDKLGRNALLGKALDAEKEVGSKPNDVKTKWETEFIIGTKDIDDDWDEFINEYRKAGYDKLEEEANIKYKP